MSIFNYLSPEKEPRRELTPIERERLYAVDAGCNRLQEAVRQQFGEVQALANREPIVQPQQQLETVETGNLGWTEENIADLERYANKLAEVNGA